MAAYLLRLAAKKFKTDEPRLSKANVLQLTNYDWPGNVRELQNIIERSVIISQKGINSCPLDLHSMISDIVNIS